MVVLSLLLFTCQRFLTQYTSLSIIFLYQIIILLDQFPSCNVMVISNITSKHKVSQQNKVLIAFKLTLVLTTSKFCSTCYMRSYIIYIYIELLSNLAIFPYVISYLLFVLDSIYSINIKKCRSKFKVCQCLWLKLCHNCYWWHVNIICVNVFSKINYYLTHFFTYPFYCVSVNICIVYYDLI